MHPQQMHAPYGYPPVMRNGLGTGSLVLGVLSMLFFWVPVLGLAAYATAITGVATGCFGVARARQRVASNGGVAMAGIVTSALGLIAVVAMTVFYIGTYVSSF